MLPSDAIAGVDPSPNGENLFNVRRLGDMSPYYAGRSPSGQCALLIRAPGGTRTVPLLLAGIHALFAVQCRIREGEAIGVTDEFTVVSCSSQDQRSESYFVDVLDLIVQRLGDHPDPKSLEDAILQLVALFQKLQKQPSNSIVGLVGELILIAIANSPRKALDAWHSNPNDRFDFSTGALRVDCKATSQRNRVHEFSLEQTSPPEGCRAFAMSVFVEPAGGGQSLSALLSELESLVENFEGAMRLRDLVADTLGTSYLEHLDWTFDRELALASAALYDVADIPRILEPLAIGVSKVRFSSDLAIAQKVTKAALRPCRLMLLQSCQPWPPHILDATNGRLCWPDRIMSIGVASCQFRQRGSSPAAWFRTRIGLWAYDIWVGWGVPSCAKNSQGGP